MEVDLEPRPLNLNRNLMNLFTANLAGRLGCWLAVQWTGRSHFVAIVGC